MGIYTYRCDGFQGSSLSLAEPAEQFTSLSGRASSMGAPRWPVAPRDFPGFCRLLHCPHWCENPGESSILACGCGCGCEKALSGQILTCGCRILASLPRNMLMMRPRPDPPPSWPLDSLTSACPLMRLALARQSCVWPRQLRIGLRPPR
jgi:hypothetical protein